MAPVSGFTFSSTAEHRPRASETILKGGRQAARVDQGVHQLVEIILGLDVAKIAGQPEAQLTGQLDRNVLRREEGKTDSRASTEARLPLVEDVSPTCSNLR